MKTIKRKVVKEVAIIGTLSSLGIILILIIMNFLFGGWTEAHLIGKWVGFIITFVTVLLGLVAFFALFWLLIFPPKNKKEASK